MLNRLRTSLLNASHDAAARTETFLREKTVRLAVTGLSRAGKTVFVTSLLANLLALGRGNDALPALRKRLEVEGEESGASVSLPMGEAEVGEIEAKLRLRSVRLVPPGSEETPLFDLDRNMAALAGQTPAWPPRTDDLSMAVVEIVVEPAGTIRKRFGTKRLRLEILDYPGEWLLDLPLLEQSFAAWSRETLERLRREPRRTAFAAFLERLPNAAPEDVPDQAGLRRLHEHYREGLRAAQDRFGLRLLQPGRFLCPGPRADAPFMWFFPLQDAPDHPRNGTVAALLRDRFEAYKADMRACFFESHFARFDRQVILADVLGALHAGEEAFHDTQAALALIAGSLSYGRSMLGRSRQGRIEQVAFVATKADHVPAGQRTNLRHLLEDLVGDARAAASKGAITFHTAASVVATTETTVERDDLLRDVVRGTPVGEGAAKLFDPGVVPSGRPLSSFWAGPRFVLPVFEPRRPRDGGTKGIQSRGLDEVVTTLLGDRL